MLLEKVAQVLGLGGIDGKELVLGLADSVNKLLFLFLALFIRLREAVGLVDSGNHGIKEVIVHLIGPFEGGHFLVSEKGERRKKKVKNPLPLFL